MKFLLTGFEPFGGGTHNPSWDCLSRLSPIEGVELIKLRLPVTFAHAPALLRNALEQEQPNAVICLGLAANRDKITPEKIAINLAHGRIADNDGFQPQEEPLIPGGTDGYFSTLPVFALVEELEKGGIPAQVSYTAGAYVCNCVMYHLMAWATPRKIPAGFVHVPDTDKMSLEDIAKGIGLMIKYLAHHHQGG